MNTNKPPLKAPFYLTVAELTFADAIEPVDVFTPFANSPWSMWLDSCESKHVDSQFDILVFNPLVTLTTYGKNTHITAHNKAVLTPLNTHKTGDTQIVQGDPLALIQNLNVSLFGDSTPKHSSLPFIGGAIGCFSYDLGRQFEKLPTKAIQDIALADMAVGIYHQAIIFDNKSKCYWLVCPENERAHLEERIKAMIQTKVQVSAFALTSPWQSNMSRESYGEKFETVQNYLLSGDCYQINLAQRFKAQYKGTEFEAYQSLRN